MVRPVIRYGSDWTIAPAVIDMYPPRQRNFCRSHGRQGWGLDHRGYRRSRYRNPALG